MIGQGGHIVSPLPFAWSGGYREGMSPEEFFDVRRELSLTVSELADLMCVDRRQIERWEAGTKPITNPVRLLLEAFLAGWRPSE
jgi:DNA-binding transcriptional regulator YiaG